MKLTQEEVEKMVRRMPGGSIAYRLEKDPERLRIIAFSDAVAAGAGYSDEELVSFVSEEPFRIVYEPDIPELQRQVRDCIHGRKELSCSGRIIHKNGQPIWVHFRGRLMGALDGQPVLLATIQNISSAVNRRDIANLVPTGMGVYAVDGGIISQAFLNDGYYKMLGLDREKRDQYKGTNTMEAVHPKDRTGVTEAVLESIEKEGTFRAAVRIQRTKNNDYIWVQLDGRMVERHGDKCIFFVSFTNIDELKRTSNELEKNRKTLEVSLAAGRQMCCEYDPVLHTMTGKTGNSHRFGLPNCVEQFPESLLHSGLMHPDDEEMVMKKVAELNAGADLIQFDARTRYGGKLRWFTFSFKRLFDAEKGYDVAICNFMDITLQKEALLAYQNHLDSVMRMNPDSISTFRMNLTKNTCGMGSSPYWNILKLQDSGTVTGFFRDAEKFIRSRKEQQQFHRTFQMDAMLEEFRRGNQRISLEHQYELEDGHSAWIKTVVDLVENPLTSDVEGVLYTKNINTEKMEEIILRETMEKDYEQIILMFTDRDEYYLFDNISQEYCVRYKEPWEEAYQRTMSWVSDETREELKKRISREYVLKKLEEQPEYSVTFQIREKPQCRYQVQFAYANSREKLLLITTRDITDAALFEKLRYDSEHDSLTGLYNREKTYMECDKLLAKHREEAFAIVRFDIQRFRLYNSFYGEKEGDRLLCYIADMFRELSARHSCGVYGRSHADVFLLCFPYREGVIEWNEVFIHERLQQYRNDFYISGCCGVYISREDHHPAKILFNWATVASKSKNTEVGHTSFYDEKIDEELLREQRIVGEMRTALSQEQFAVYLQPKYRVDSGKPAGAEALVRWIHPQHGLVPPDAFIPIFERNGFITELDRYMWEHVCRLLHQWTEEGLSPAPVSVNMSRVSMYSPQTVSFLSELVKRYDISPSLLELELTESAFMEDPRAMKQRLMELQGLGFRIMMDDFGSAYSSLNALRELPVDYLKVDRKFLASVEKDQRSRIVLSSVAAMAAALSIPVIVEGVENVQQRDFVASIGCEYIQGYFYARPMPVEAYERDILGKSKNSSGPAID